MKLIRDELANVISADKLVINNDAVLLEIALKLKMYEEIHELQNTTKTEHFMEEIADILEVIDQFGKLKYNVSLIDMFDSILDIKRNKTKNRGGFKKGVFLTCD